MGGLQDQQHEITQKIQAADDDGDEEYDPYDGPGDEFGFD